jgi:hypothetical protein
MWPNTTRYIQHSEKRQVTNRLWNRSRKVVVVQPSEATYNQGVSHSTIHKTTLDQSYPIDCNTQEQHTYSLASLERLQIDSGIEPESLLLSSHLVCPSYNRSIVGINTIIEQWYHVWHTSTQDSTACQATVALDQSGCSSVVFCVDSMHSISAISRSWMLQLMWLRCIQELEIRQAAN